MYLRQNAYLQGLCQLYFTANEQEFYASKGFANEPGRCPACSEPPKNNTMEAGAGAEIAKCIRQLCQLRRHAPSVPFRPTGDKPVYCHSSCYMSKR